MSSMEMLHHLRAQGDRDQGSVTIQDYLLHNQEVVTIRVVGVEGGRPVNHGLRKATLDQGDKFLVQWGVCCSLLQSLPCDHPDWGLGCKDVVGGQVCDGHPCNAGNAGLLLLNLCTVSL